MQPKFTILDTGFDVARTEGNIHIATNSPNGKFYQEMRLEIEVAKKLRDWLNQNLPE